MPPLTIRRARTEEFTPVRAFYHDVIDRMENAPYSPAWQKDVYPSDDYLRTLIDAGQLYLGLIGTALVAAMALQP